MVFSERLVKILVSLLLAIASGCSGSEADSVGDTTDSPTLDTFSIRDVGEMQPSIDIEEGKSDLLDGVAAPDLWDGRDTDGSPMDVSPSDTVTRDSDAAPNADAFAFDSDLDAEAGLWTGSLVQLVGTSGTDTATGVATDSNGNVYLSGVTTQSLDGRSFNGGRSDAFLSKYDNSGNRKWTRLLGTIGVEAAYDLAVDRSGNIVIVGSTNGKLGSRQNRRYDAFVAKFDAAGNRKWVRLVGTKGTDEANGVTTTSTGAVVVVGDAAFSLAGRTHAGGSSDGFIAKFSTNGARRWIRLVGSAGTDSMASVDSDSSGNLYIAGLAGAKIGSRTYNGGQGDALVTKYDKTGMQIWLELLGTSGLDGAYGVAAAQGGGLGVTGRAGGSMAGHAHNGGRFDGFVARFDSTGTRVWTRLVGSMGDDVTWRIAFGPKGHFQIVGATPHRLPGNRYNGGPLDGFVAEYDGNGKRKGITLIGTLGRDEATGVTVAPSGFTYISGSTSAPLAGRAYNGGVSDAFFVRLR